jgi:hypothetical protein
LLLTWIPLPCGSNRLDALCYILPVGLTQLAEFNAAVAAVRFL